MRCTHTTVTNAWLVLLQLKLKPFWYMSLSHQCRKPRSLPWLPCWAGYSTPPACAERASCARGESGHRQLVARAFVWALHQCSLGLSTLPGLCLFGTGRDQGACGCAHPVLRPRRLLWFLLLRKALWLPSASRAPWPHHHPPSDDRARDCWLSVPQTLDGPMREF